MATLSAKSAKEDAVLRRIESMADEISSFLSELIKIPTVNPPGESYVDGARFLGEKLRALGYEVEYVAAEERPENTKQHPRLNVIGAMKGQGPGGGAHPLLHFDGHFDVVPVGDGWSREPFGGEKVGEGGEARIYGRGAADQEAGVGAG